MRHAFSEGARKLGEVAGSLKDVADSCSCTKQAVAKWKSGVSRPTHEMRRILEKRWKIPFDDWERRAVSHGPAPAYAPPLPLVEVEPVFARDPEERPRKAKKPRPLALGGDHPSVKEDMREIIEYQLEDLVRLRDEVDKEGVLADRLKVRDQMRRTAVDLAKARGELDKADETKLCKSAKWIRLRESILTVLTDFPEALKAVVEALEREEAQ